MINQISIYRSLNLHKKLDQTAPLDNPISHSIAMYVYLLQQWHDLKFSILSAIQSSNPSKALTAIPLPYPSYHGACLHMENNCYIKALKQVKTPRIQALAQAL